MGAICGWINNNESLKQKQLIFKATSNILIIKHSMLLLNI